MKKISHLRTLMDCAILPTARWSSPVARLAHNQKVDGSNPSRAIMKFLSLACLIVTACANPFAPAEPWKDGAVRVSNPTFEAIWNETEKCSGLTGNFSAVKFYVTPKRFAVDNSGALAHGAWIKSENAIYMASGYETLHNSVMHEEMHALLQRTDHPSEYFRNGGCGPLM